MRKRKHRYFREIDPLRILQAFRSKLLMDWSESGSAGYAALDNAIGHHIGDFDFSFTAITRSRHNRNTVRWRSFLESADRQRRMQ